MATKPKILIAEIGPASDRDVAELAQRAVQIIVDNDIDDRDYAIPGAVKVLALIRRLEAAEKRSVGFLG